MMRIAAWTLGVALPAVAVWLATSTAATTVGGSLLVLVPYSDGIILAADGRKTLRTAEGDEYCDHDKIFALPKRMAFAVVGDAAIITEPPPPNTADPCAYLKTAKRFDVEEIVRKFLETSGSNSLVDLDLSPLLNSISDQFTAFGAGHADLLKKFAGETLFTVVIASYVPAQQTSLFVYFSALLGRDQKVAFSPPETKRYTSDLEASYKLFGESRYVELYVTSPYGSIFYDPKIWKALEGHRIGVITRDQAANFARHLVDATARVTGEIVPALGGQSGCFLLDANRSLNTFSEIFRGERESVGATNSLAYANGSLPGHRGRR